MSILIASEDRVLPSAEETTGKSAVRGRVCNRAGCGKPLLTHSGRPDYRRHFCGRGCRLADQSERLRLRRARAAGRKCPVCGRESTGDRRFARSFAHKTPFRIADRSEAGQGVLKTA
jgi:endogenous inhibitor of DNA gyrase (YacG/DUF329 family)